MSLQRELAQYREEYADALEAIHHQQLVIQRLEQLLWRKLPVLPLTSDAATQTDHEFFSSTQSVFFQIANMRMRIERTRERNRVASLARDELLSRMEKENSDLRDMVADKVPPEYQVELILSGVQSSATPIPAANVPEASKPKPQAAQERPSESRASNRSSNGTHQNSAELRAELEKIRNERQNLSSRGSQDSLRGGPAGGDGKANGTGNAHRPSETPSQKQNPGLMTPSMESVQSVGSNDSDRERRRKQSQQV
jgi:hypothetical protein